MKECIEPFSRLYGKTYELLLKEGILKLPSSIISQIEHEIIPGLRKLCIRDNISNSAILDMPRLLSPSQLHKWKLDSVRSTPGLMYIPTNLSITGTPIGAADAETWPVHLCVYTVQELAEVLDHSYGSFDSDNGVVRISVLSVAELDEEIISSILDGSITDTDYLNYALQAQQVFTLKAVEGTATKNARILSLIGAVQRIFGFKKIQTVLEHELLHAIDPTVRRSQEGGTAANKTIAGINKFIGDEERKGRSNKDIQKLIQQIQDTNEYERLGIDYNTAKTAGDFYKLRKRYTSGNPEDYYRTPGLYTGKTPMEYNPLFWNIIRKYNPLTETDKRDLLKFLKNPDLQNLPSKLNEFKTFINMQLKYKNTRRKFLQRLATWVSETSQSQTKEQ